MNAPLVMPSFIPTRAKKGNRNVQREAAAKFRELLCETLTDNGPMGSRELAELTGSTVNTVRDYLSDMIYKGIVKSEKVKGRNHPTGGTVMCLYSLVGDDPAEPELVVHRPVLKEYPANQVRDPFHLPQNFFSRTA